jgi:antitoxin (DNA-binding transcriptional repressor) of toxin-antitoxin stability system
METKAVGIKELKNKFSAYIREVRSGVRILLTDRNEVVAELRKPDLSALPGTKSALLETWIREGKVIPGSGERPYLPPSPIRSPKGTVQRLLDQERGD